MVLFLTVIELLVHGVIMGLMGGILSYFLSNNFQFLGFFILGICMHIFIKGIESIYRSNVKFVENGKFKRN